MLLNREVSIPVPVAHGDPAGFGPRDEGTHAHIQKNSCAPEPVNESETANAWIYCAA